MYIPKPLRDLIEYYLPDWRQRGHDLRAAGKRWLRHTKLHAVKLFVLYLTAPISFLLVFGLANDFWFTFRHTPVGSMFLSSHPPAALLAILNATNTNNLLPLAFQFSLDAAVTCLLLGFACQLSAITRYCYTGRGLLNRLLWVALGAALSSLAGLEARQQFDFTTGFALSLVPAGCLVGGCLEFTAHLLPEIWIVLKLRDLRHFIQVARIRNAPRQTDGR